jgi:tetratricopeptide (TPR) repeat protein
VTPTLVLVALLAQVPALPAPVRPAPPLAIPPDTAAVGRAYFLYLQGLMAEDADDLATAIGSYREAIRLLPGAAEIHGQLATLYAGQNQLTDAAAEARAAVAISPREPSANRLLGWIEYLSIDTAPAAGRDRIVDDAIGHLEIAVADTDPDPRAQLWLSDLYLRRADGAKAIALLKNFLAAHPDYPEGLRMLARAYQVSGLTDEAAETLDTLASAPPDLFESRVRQIGRLERSGRWTEAASSWADLIDQDPTGALYRTRYAAALANIGDFARARQALVDASRDNPKSTAVLYLLALVDGRAGDAAAADAAVARITAIDANDPRAPLALAHVRASRKDYAGAVKALEARVASPLATDLSSGLYTEMAETLADAFESLGKKSRGTEALEDAQKHDPHDERLLFVLAAAYDEDGRDGDAEKSLRTLIRENGNHAPALNYLGYMFAEHGRNLPEAVDLINRALVLDRDNPSFLDSLGWAYLKMGDLDKARTPLEKAASALPQASVIQDHLGDVYLKMERYREAGDAFDRALKGDLDGVDAAAVTKKRDRARALAAGRS